MVSRDYTCNLCVQEIHIKPSPPIQHSDRMYGFNKEIFKQHVINEIQHFLGTKVTISTNNYVLLCNVAVLPLDHPNQHELQSADTSYNAAVIQRSLQPAVFPLHFMYS